MNLGATDQSYRAECGALMGEALSLRDAIEKRLVNPPPKPEHGELIAFQSILAGPTPVQDAALYLEVMAKQLASQQK